MGTKYAYPDVATHIWLELKEHREQLSHFIQDISMQMTVAPKWTVVIESDNMSFFVVTSYV